jgi:undecaprenyl diphosphate synthase
MTLVEPKKLPQHVGVIMDGNGRWARSRGFHRSIGHAKGSSTVKPIIDAARSSCIKVLSLYCFSTENWSRPDDEIAVLMDLLRDYLIQEREELMRGNIKVFVLGQMERLPSSVREILESTLEETKNNTGMILNFCLSYGGRLELTEAIKKIAADVQAAKVSVEAIDETMIAGALYTAGMPDPDLIIRTSGEFRTSNFLLWQSAYSEYYITETMWPDFTPEEFGEALEWYSLRKRRFGHSDEVSAQARLRQGRLADMRNKNLSEEIENSP